MADYIIRDTTLTAIADSIRAKTGKTDKIAPENMPAEIEGITGGGSAAGCVTVTFMNGDTVLFTRPVYIGDDCPDPYVQNRIELPTKESTAQYTYTFNGWSATAGGAADANALKNITADKTLYAAFNAVTRTYTIRFFDEDGTTLLQTLTVEYNKVPAPTTPTHATDPDHYIFSTWSPSLAQATADADYTVVWKEKKALADYTWAELDAMSVDEVKANFKIGDQRRLKTGVSSSLLVTLIGIEHDDLSDGSGKAKMTFFIDKMPYIVTASSGVVVNRQFTLDKNVSYLDQSNRPNSSKFVSGRFAWDDVSEVNPFVKTVKKKYFPFLGSYLDISSVSECSDTYFWLSLSELGYSDFSGGHNTKLGEKYEYFTAKSSDTEIANDGILNTSYSYTRTQQSTDHWYAVRKGYKPNTNTIKCYFTCGFCI